MSLNPTKFYTDTGLKIVKSVFYTGSDILYEGEAVCYDFDYGTATTAETERRSRVERPSRTNNMYFAGVAAHKTYAAKTGGQMIQIYLSGSENVPIALGANPTLGKRLTFTSGEGGNGRFSWYGYAGRGSVIMEQTVTAGVKESALFPGDTLGVATLGTAATTLTDSNAAFVVNGVSAGDIVYVVAGENDGTDYATPGKFIVSSVTSATEIILTTVCGTAGGTMLVYYYVISANNSTALGTLLDGEESGGVYFLSMDETADLVNIPIGGLVVICCSWATGADISTTLARSMASLSRYPLDGQKMKFYLNGTIQTNDYLLKFTDTLYMRGRYVAPATTGTANIYTLATLASLEFDSKGDYAEIQYQALGIRAVTTLSGDAWILQVKRGPTAA